MANYTLAFAAGYMVNDLVLGVYFPGLMEPPMVAHHFAVLLMFFGALASEFAIPFQVRAALPH